MIIGTKLILILNRNPTIKILEAKDLFGEFLNSSIGVSQKMCQIKMKYKSNSKILYYSKPQKYQKKTKKG
jgi:hypothetical protein